MKLIPTLAEDGFVTVNHVFLKEGLTSDDIFTGFSRLCAYVKTYHSDNGFLGSLVLTNEGRILDNGDVIDHEKRHKEVLLMTFWVSEEAHRKTHQAVNFPAYLEEAISVAQNGNQEFAYSILWSGAAYTHDEIPAAKANYAKFNPS